VWFLLINPWLQSCEGHVPFAMLIFVLFIRILKQGRKVPWRRLEGHGGGETRRARPSTRGYGSAALFVAWKTPINSALTT